jgi:hypothetical protein
MVKNITMVNHFSNAYLSWNTFHGLVNPLVYPKKRGKAGKSRRFYVYPEGVLKRGWMISLAYEPPGFDVPAWQDGRSSFLGTLI